MSKKEQKQTEQTQPQIKVENFEDVSKCLTEIYFGMGAFQANFARISHGFSEFDGKWMSNFLICEAILALLEKKEVVTREEIENEMTRLAKEIQEHRDALAKETEAEAQKQAQELTESAEAAVKAAAEKQQ